MNYVELACTLHSTEIVTVGEAGEDHPYTNYVELACTLHSTEIVTVGEAGEDHPYMKDVGHGMYTAQHRDSHSRRGMRRSSLHKGCCLLVAECPSNMLV